MVSIYISHSIELSCHNTVNDFCSICCFFAPVSNTDNGISNEVLTNFTKTLDIIENSLKRSCYVKDVIPPKGKKLRE